MRGNDSPIARRGLSLALTIVAAGGAWLTLDRVTGTGQGDASPPKAERKLRFVDPIVAPARPAATGRSRCPEHRHR